MKLIFLTLLFAMLLYSAIPSFREPIIVQADGEDLSIGVIADPFMIDWDNDGLKDLIVGQFFPPKISFFKNIGSSENPEFTFSGFLSADGEEIELTYG